MAIIRVSGHPGAGKTALCEKLARTLNYQNYYTGQIFKDLAKEQGLTEDELYKRMATQPAFEIRTDGRVSNLMMTEDNIIVQGRMAPFQKHNKNFKKINLFLKVSDEVGAQRQLNRPGNKDMTFDEMLTRSRSRIQTERERYLALYGIKDHFDESKFDIVIDTTEFDLDQVFFIVCAALKKLGIEF